MCIQNVKFIVDKQAKVDGVEDEVNQVSRQFEHEGIPDEYILDCQLTFNNEKSCRRIDSSVAARNSHTDAVKSIVKALRRHLENPGINNDFYYTATLIQASRKSDRIKALDKLSYIEQARVILAFSEYAEDPEEVAELTSRFPEAMRILDVSYIAKKDMVWRILSLDKLMLQDRIGLFHALGSLKQTRQTRENVLGLELGENGGLIKHSYLVYDRTYLLDHYLCNGVICEIVVRDRHVDDVSEDQLTSKDMNKKAFEMVNRMVNANLPTVLLSNEQMIDKLERKIKMHEELKSDIDLNGSEMMKEMMDGAIQNMKDEVGARKEGTYDPMSSYLKIFGLKKLPDHIRLVDPKQQ